jgi:hypothetical protein
MKNEKKQTAVEWLFSYMFNPSHPHEEQFELLKQAKEMEKWQIKETASTYYHENTKLTPTQYYNETYGENEQ